MVRRFPASEIHTRHSFLLLVFVAVILMAGVIALFSCVANFTNESVKTSEDTGDSSYVCPYDWALMMWENDRPVYYQNGQPVSSLGVDVSDHNGAIDWDAVASDGVQFAMVRLGNRGATEGLIYLDDRFEANVLGASSANLSLGAYFFSQAVSDEEAQEEARFVIEQLQRMESQGVAFRGAIAFDHEPLVDMNARANGLSSEERSDITQAFCQMIESAGYRAMIYGNRRELFRTDLAVRERFPVWLAEYNVLHPTARLDYVMWQYSASGQVKGIDSPVDMNIRFFAE